MFCLLYYHCKNKIQNIINNHISKINQKQFKTIYFSPKSLFEKQKIIFSFRSKNINNNKLDQINSAIDLNDIESF